MEPGFQRQRQKLQGLLRSGLWNSNPITSVILVKAGPRASLVQGGGELGLDSAS